MYINIYVCICIYVWITIYICMYVYIYKYLPLREPTPSSAGSSQQWATSWPRSVAVCMHTNIYLCIYIHMCVCKYIRCVYIYTFRCVSRQHRQRAPRSSGPLAGQAASLSKCISMYIHICVSIHMFYVCIYIPSAA